MLAGVCGDRLAEGEAGHAVAEADDFAAELVAEDALILEAGERVRRLHGDEYRAGQVFVQVGAADAAPVHADLHPAGRRLGRERHVFHADIVAAVPDGGAHRRVGLRGTVHVGRLLNAGGGSRAAGG